MTRLKDSYSSFDAEHLIAQIPGDRLLAWSLVSETDMPAEVRLPSGCAYLSGHRGQVGIITTSREILVWHIGGRLTSIAVSTVPQCPAGWPGPVAIAFHPDNAHLQYVVYLLPVSDRGPGFEHTMNLLIRECVSGAEDVPDVFHQYPQTLGNGRILNPSYRVVGLEDGGIGLMLSDGTNRTYELVLIQFDIWNCSFSSKIYDLPGDASADPDYRTPRTSRAELLDFREASRLVDRHRYLLYRCHRRQGDDDFVVQLDPTGYTVWCYDENVTLPVLNA